MNLDDMYTAYKESVLYNEIANHAYPYSDTF